MHMCKNDYLIDNGKRKIKQNNNSNNYNNNKKKQTTTIFSKTNTKVL